MTDCRRKSRSFFRCAICCESEKLTKNTNKLQQPVTWQPSADGRRLIGHMVLNRFSSGAKGDLGLKVVGGRRTTTGRLGAFVTRVKRGSLADTVGRLRPGSSISLFIDFQASFFPGDEVLEWNGRSLRDASFEQVYEIISDSKHDAQVHTFI